MRISPCLVPRNCSLETRLGIVNTQSSKAFSNIYILSPPVIVREDLDYWYEDVIGRDDAGKLPQLLEKLLKLKKGCLSYSGTGPCGKSL